MIRRLFKLTSVRIAATVYLILWILTGVVGNRKVDRAFDEQFRYGHDYMNSDERVEITRIRKLFVRDLQDPRNAGLFPANELFRYRGMGIAVAPFLIVDEIGTIFAPLGGVGGIRLNLWFFGEPKTLFLHPYWHV